MNNPETITIDGPAGAGKSTLGDLVARRLGFLYFDTGVMYRALTLAALRQSIPGDDEAALATLARALDIELEAPNIADGRQYTVLVDDEDVTWELRKTDVDRHVSQIASHPQVRAVMRARQREIGQRGRVVMVGRDIGTIVLPEARLKIYLEASLRSRAERRVSQIRERGEPADIHEIESDVARRDDMDRHVMDRAPDAIVLNNDELSPDQEVEVVLEHWQHVTTDA